MHQPPPVAVPAAQQQQQQQQWATIHLGANQEQTQQQQYNQQQQCNNTTHVAPITYHLGNPFAALPAAGLPPFMQHEPPVNGSITDDAANAPAAGTHTARGGPAEQLQPWQARYHQRPFHSSAADLVGDLIPAHTPPAAAAGSAAAAALITHHAHAAAEELMHEQQHHSQPLLTPQHVNTANVILPARPTVAEPALLDPTLRHSGPPAGPAATDGSQGYSFSNTTSQYAAPDDSRGAFGNQTKKTLGAAQKGATITGEYFSSYAFPQSVASAAVSPLPMGVIVQPNARLQPEPPRVKAMPSSCSNCGAFVNQYCELVAGAQRWRCCFCKTINAFPTDVVGGGSANAWNQDSGAMVSDKPSAHMAHQGVKTVEYILQEQPVSTLSMRTAKHGGGPLSQMEQCGDAGIATHVLIFVVDGHASREKLETFRKSVDTMLREVADTTHLGLVVFDSAVHVYHLGSKNANGAMEDSQQQQQTYAADLFVNAATAHSVSGANRIDADSLDFLLDWDVVNDHVLVPSAPNGASRLLEALDALAAGSSQEFQSKLQRKLGDSNKKGAQSDESGIFRSLGAALEAALYIVRRLRVRLPGVAHVVACLTGRPNYGPGALVAPKDIAAMGDNATNPCVRPLDRVSTDCNALALSFYASLAKRALGPVQVVAEVGSLPAMPITFHICAATSCDRGDNDVVLPILSHLAGQTGGSVMKTDGFGLDFAQDLMAALTGRCRGTCGNVVVLLPPALTIARIIGHVTPSQVPYRGPKDDDHVRRYRYRLTSMRHDHSLNLYFDMQDDISDEYVYFQFITVYSSWNMERIMRVSTRRVLVTGRLATVVRSMDADVVSVLAARRSVLLAHKTEVVRYTGRKKDADSGDMVTLREVVTNVDDQVADIGKRLGMKDESGGFVTKLSLEVESVVRALYQLRRSVLLGCTSVGGRVVSNDQVTALRLFFLTCEHADCMRLLCPSFLAFNARGDFEELPFVTLAMQSDRVLYLDQHTHIFVWSGCDVQGEDFDLFREACRERAEVAARGRIPQPLIVMVCEQLQEGHRATDVSGKPVGEDEVSVEERLLDLEVRERAVPLHQDDYPVQAAALPSFSQLTVRDRTLLCRKFAVREEPSYHQYCQALFI